MLREFKSIDKLSVKCNTIFKLLEVIYITILASFYIKLLTSSQEEVPAIL
jgi:hypothetical protein